MAERSTDNTADNAQKRRTPRDFVTRFICLVALALLPSTPPTAAQGWDPEPTTQFVFVIDDSRSMSEASQGYEAADPDRLAVFAVRSLVAMLDDRDEVTVVRLNGPASGEEPLPPIPLARGRARVEEQLALDGVLARYGGANTPCRSALDAVGRLLDEVQEDGVPQVVLFLTDGDCNQGEVSAKRWLAPIKSHVYGQLQFYLLRFAGRPYDRELVAIAKRSGGQSIEVRADDPTTLLEPFADALGRSQGYEAEVLTPDQPRLADYRGARRLRLLAVARGEGGALGLEVRRHRGGVAASLRGGPVTGVHRFGDGEVFRYSALDVRPEATGLEVAVSGAGEGWKVVAVPEYRLSVRLALHSGACDDPEAPERSSIAAGETLCAVMTVVDGEGQSVTGELAASGLDATVRLARLEQQGNLGSLPELHASQRPGRSEFVFERPNLEAGAWQIEPRVRLRLAGGGPGRPLPTVRRTFHATTVDIALTPREVDFGDLLPGEVAAAHLLELEGNFPPTRGRLERVGEDAWPPCAVFTLGDAAEGESVPIRQGQSYSLGLRIASYCGPETFTRSFGGELRLVLDRTAEADLPAQRFSVRFGLDHRIEVPSSIDLALTAGESRQLAIPFEGNAQQRGTFRVVFEPGDGWPSGELDLRLAPDGGKAADRFDFDPGQGADRPATLVVQSTVCCAAGDYSAWLRFEPLPGEPGIEVPRPLVVPLRLRVESAGVWACRGATILRTTGWLLLLLAVLYLVSMVRNSRFLSADQLAKSLTPLRWDEMGAVVRHGRSEPEVRAMVRRGLGWRARTQAWLRANPLVFGWPGRRYHETVEVALQPERGVERSRVTLVAERDHLARILTRPQEVVGRLFARAAAGRSHQFYAVPKKGVRIGRLAPENLLSQAIDGHDSGGYGAADYGTGDDTDSKPKVLRLRKRRRLIHPIPDEEREEGRAAGWQLG